MGQIPRFDPALFSHGRLLYRFEGSDACRFSPKLAMRLLSHLADEEQPPVLWDPFCGTGLIPCVARVFFSRGFSRILASDFSEEAVLCTEKNMALWEDGETRNRRLRELKGFQGLNPRSAERWREVEDYYRALLPELEEGPPMEVFQGAAEDVQRPIDAPLVFLSDLPYERCSFLAKSPSPLEALFRHYPESKGLFVVGKEADIHPRELSRHLVDRRPLQGGRSLIQITPKKH